MDEIEYGFNDGKTIPLIPYSCISYLLQNNDIVWKLLKDKTADAWKIANLTREEKAKMIYPGKGDMNDFHVYMDDYVDDAFTTETTILRIFPISEVPETRSVTYVDIAMAVYTHTNCNHLSNYETRVDRIIQQLKEVFNGADIPKVGQLVFDQARSRKCQVTPIGRIPYKGKMIIFNTISASVKEDGC
jgi:hypothetical protein